MSKKPIIGAILIMAVGAALPHYIGLMIKWQMYHKVEEMKTSLNLPFWISFELENYRLGWLSSSADTTLTIDPSRLMPVSFKPGVPPLPGSFRVVLHHEFQHGPLILSPKPALAMAAGVSRLVIPEQYRQIVRNYFKDQAPFESTFKVSLFGDNEVHTTIPAYSGPSHIGGLMIDWKGLDAMGHSRWFDAGGKLSGTMPLLMVHNAGMHFAIRSVSIEGNTRFSDYGILGSTSMKIGEIDGLGPTPQGMQHFDMKELGVSVNSDLVDGLMKAEETFGFATLDAGSDIEQFKAGPGELRIAFRKIDAQAFTALMKEMQSMQQAALQQGMMPVGMSDKLVDLASTLLKQSPEIEIERAHLTLDDGEINARVKTVFNAAGPLNIKNPASLGKLMSSDGEISIPAELSSKLARQFIEKQMRAMAMRQGQTAPPVNDPQQMEQAAAGMIANFEQSGLLVREGDQHKIGFHVENGMATINGISTDDLRAGFAPKP